MTNHYLGQFAAAIEVASSVGNVDDLASHLYSDWYASPVGLVRRPRGFPFDLVQVLRSADAAAQSWSSGWIATRVAGNGQVIAQRRGRVRLVDRCDHVVLGRRGVMARAGDQLTIADRHDRVDSDGWWRAAGEAWRFSRVDSRPLVRLYWNFELDALPGIVSALTTLLATERRPWMLKCARDVDAHSRADAVVLFLSAEALDGVAPALGSIVDSHASAAREGAPPLTLNCQRGLALAVDPSSNESFGEHRCRLVAEALAVTRRIDGASRGEDLVGGLERIADRFRQDDIDVSRPYATRTTDPIAWEPSIAPHLEDIDVA